MTNYNLEKLAPGTYDILLAGETVAALTQARGAPRDWRAELLEDLPPVHRPAPFVELEHRFTSLDDVKAWFCLQTSGDAA
jgi:hypothetical protein